MPHVITQPCCNDASCVPVCPVGCIHPTPDEPGFAGTEALYIDPATCIDCGVCVSACPVDAIVPEHELRPNQERYRDLNAAFFADKPRAQELQPVFLPPLSAPAGTGTLRVAVVGSGPAGAYAVGELLEYPNIEVTLFDRLPTPWGLVRAGVAPDHPGTKAVTEEFERTIDNGRVRLHLNVEIGAHLSHADLLAHHHAVIYAYGASGDRRLGVPGDDLPGSVAATEFVNWYNGHPDFADPDFDLSGERAVIVGNGNVALDVARVLVTDPDRLARTDMAEHAVDALRHSDIDEVVVLGRRGPAQAAYTTPELLALADLDGVDVLADPAETELDELSRAHLAEPGTPPSARIKAELAAEFARNTPRAGNRRIVLRYLAAPAEILGDTKVSGLRVARNQLARNKSGRIVAEPTGASDVLDAGLVLRSVGYRGKAIDGVPFDERRGVLPNDGGRVRGAAGAYTTGWIKRGPSGVIGTNKACARDTVANVVEDARAGRLADPAHSTDDLAALVRTRRPEAVSITGWRAIDTAERARGRAAGKARSKLVQLPDLLAAAAGD